MRSHEERVAAVRQRMAQIERQKRQRGNCLLALSSVAACLAVIVDVSFAMPGISGKLVAGNYAEYETAASIFGGSAAAGYIIIGLLAFFLGVCVTVLCFKLKAFRKKEGERSDSDGRVH
ncbi:MAG TPA: DUF4179 domain-containing protein [Candidatus Eisenbergiella pullicola]|nr:DUF4179 domain-containing protein [Candidatus Eisenbergiella pullicola]